MILNVPTMKRPMTSARMTSASTRKMNKPKRTGLDDGPLLPGHHDPLKKRVRKTPRQLATIRAKAWETRRAKKLELSPYDRVAEHNRLNAERETKGYPPIIEWKK